MRVYQHALAAAAAEQVVDRRVQRLALDVPKGDVHRGDGGHRDGSAPPVGAAIQVLPDVFYLRGIAADEAGDDVLGKIAGDGELAAVERRVAESVKTFVRLDLERDEVAVGRADDEACVRNFHSEPW